MANVKGIKGKRCDVEKFVNDQKVGDSFKVTIGGAYEPLITLLDLYINQLYEKFKNETNRITERIVGIMRNQKMEDLEKEVENLCKQRRDAKLPSLNKKWSFPLIISSVDVTKSAISCKSGHI